MRGFLLVGIQGARQLDLIGVKIHPAVRRVKRDNLFNKIFFVVIENLEIKISKEIEINLVAIVPNAHYTGTVLIEQTYLPREWLELKLFPGDHEINLSKSISLINRWEENLC
jgi:hypothetical protein